MKISPRHLKPTSINRRGFTLVELLVVISIIAVLAALSFTMATRVIQAGKKTTCINLFRNLEIAMESYEVDYNKPPLPRTKDSVDTVFGDPNPKYHTDALVGVLTGSESSEWVEDDGSSFDLTALNPRRIVYLDLSPGISTKEAGLAQNGRLYDAWGRELMIAVNSRKQRQEFNNGEEDEILHTWGLAEWAESKPKYQSYVFWSYGRDGIKGKGKNSKFQGSDDVKSF